MAKREVLGIVECPECGHDGAEIKAQKNGLLYRYCPECNAQYFPRTEAASDRLRAKLQQPKAPEAEPVTVPETKPEQVQASKPAQKVAPVAPVTKTKSTFGQALEILGVK